MTLLLSGRSRIRIWCGAAVALIAVAFYVIVAGLDSHPWRIRLKGVPALSFTELQQIVPFAARVEWKQSGTRNPPVDNSTGKPNPGAKPTQYILLYLLKDDGKRLAIYEENVTSNEVRFVSQLREGERYQFPDAYTAWIKRN